MRKLWISFAVVVAVSFGILGWIGTRIYLWGHGSYVAPDWTADWLHREAMFVLGEWAQKDYNKSYEQLPAEDRARLRGRLTALFRANTYDASTNAIVVDPARMRQLAAFVFWTAWSASTNRPGDTVSYTHNWPHEPLIENRPTGESVMWTGVSIIMLLAGICALIWWYASQKREEETGPLPKEDPLGSWRATPSQKATLKYFWVVAALILVQILMGVVTAHYGVEGDGFYGIPLSKWLPYSVARTWHVQLGIFWIATAWLAAGP